MFKNYLKIALRNLYKNKLYSMINIIGLGVAVGVCVAGYVNYQYSQSFDSFHENAEHIYAINSYNVQNDFRQNWSYIPMPMAPIIKKDIPGIEKLSRISVSGGTLRYGDKVFNESFFLVEKDFFEMFSFPIKWGNKETFNNQNSMVITEEIAGKYFGSDNPVGKQLILSPDGERVFDFIVRGVIQTPPKNSSLPIDIIIPFERFEELSGVNLSDWKSLARATFIQVAAKSSPAKIEGQLQVHTKQTNESNPDWKIQGFYLMPLLQLANSSGELSGGPFRQGMHPAAIVAPSVTALLVLLLACFNFVNTAIAFSSKRLKEIGVRKVMGGLRSQLVKQFLGENLLLCFIALLLGMLLAEIFVPAYDSLWPELSLSINYSDNLGLIGFLTGLLLFTALAAGAYPAFYVSAFNPVSIFRGEQKLGGTNQLIRVLLTFQFAISITAIIGSTILT